MGGCCSGNGSDDLARKSDTFQKINQMEAKFPLRQMRVEAFLGAIRAKNEEKPYLSVAELQEIFQDDAEWNDLKYDDTILFNIINDVEFRHKRRVGEISKRMLMIWGLLLCEGEIKMKAGILYDLIYYKDHPDTSKSYNDFVKLLKRCVRLSTSILYEQESRYSGLIAPKNKYDSRDLAVLRGGIKN